MELEFKIWYFCSALVYLLTSGQLVETTKTSLVPEFQWLLFALGEYNGLYRLSKGCNAGALYTPIAQMSLSGWIFLLALIVGGILGNHSKNI